MTRPVLAASLERDVAGVRRFLTAAVLADRPDMSALCQAEVPAYDARLYLSQLEQAGEIAAGSWDAQARLTYQDLLAQADSAADSNRLDRLPEHLRPRERARDLGVGALHDAELLAILLRTGGREGVLELAERLLAEHDGLLGLAACDVQDLMQQEGLGLAKASEVATAFELGRRLAQARRRERPSMRGPEEVVSYLRETMACLRHEEFWCLPLDVRSRLIGEPRLVSRGDIDGTEAGPRAFFRAALAAGAASAIAVHNHPTGDAAPSEADRAVTRRLVEAGHTLDLPLADHLIIGDGGRFTSLRREQPALFSR